MTSKITKKDGSTTASVFEPADGALNLTSGNSTERLPLESAYLVTLDCAGGECIAEGVYADFGGIIRELPVPVRDGYEFLGWYIESGDMLEVGGRLFANLTARAEWRALSADAPDPADPAASPASDSPWLPILIGGIGVLAVAALVLVFIFKGKAKRAKA